jgi:hypothetical protein
MSSRAIKPEELLDLADILAGRGAGRGRPRTVHMRRAVSSAYYALFHELVNAACEELLGDGPTAETQRNTAARWFSHTDLRHLANAVLAPSGGGGHALSSVLVPAHGLVRVADAFVTLQEQRERADYDHTYDIDRESALTYVDLARDATVRLRELRRRRDASTVLFLRLMTGAVKIAKRR